MPTVSMYYLYIDFCRLIVYTLLLFFTYLIVKNFNFLLLSPQLVVNTKYNDTSIKLLLKLLQRDE